MFFFLFWPIKRRRRVEMETGNRKYGERNKGGKKKWQKIHGKRIKKKGNNEARKKKNSAIDSTS